MMEINVIYAVLGLVGIGFGAAMIGDGDRAAGAIVLVLSAMVMIFSILVMAPRIWGDCIEYQPEYVIDGVEYQQHSSITVCPKEGN